MRDAPISICAPTRSTHGRANCYCQPADWLVLRKRGERVEAQEFDLAPGAITTLSER
jgi:hypothetical protein